MLNLVQTYNDLSKIKDAREGVLVKVQSSDNMPILVKKMFYQNCCDNFMFSYNSTNKSWDPCILIQYVPWHIRQLLESGELQLASDASQLFVESLRKFGIQLTRKEDSCGPSSQDQMDQKSSTLKQERQLAQSTPTEISGEHKPAQS